MLVVLPAVRTFIPHESHRASFSSSAVKCVQSTLRFLRLRVVLVNVVLLLVSTIVSDRTAVGVLEHDGPVPAVNELVGLALKELVDKLPLEAMK